MQRETDKQPYTAAIDVGQLGVQRCRPGAAALDPAVAENAGDAVEIPEAAMLHGDKRGRGGSGDQQSDQDRRREPRIRLQPDEQRQSERRVRQLGNKFEGYVDDRAGGRDAPGRSGQRQGAGAEHVAADLR